MKKMDLFSDKGRDLLQKKILQGEIDLHSKICFADNLKSSWTELQEKFSVFFRLYFMTSDEMRELGFIPRYFMSLFANDGDHAVVVNIKELLNTYNCSFELWEVSKTFLLHEMGHCLTYKESGYVEEDSDLSSVENYYNSAPEKLANERVGLSTFQLVEAERVFESLKK